MIGEHVLWTEKYRPRKVADCILPKDTLHAFQKMVETKSVPNLLLTGSPGVGKTSVAKAMLTELDSDYIVINGSMNGNIDTLRTNIQSFASTVSFNGGRKFVLLDEADHVNPNSTQPAMRNFMEEFAGNCGFILTANYRDRIIPALRSRLSNVEFKIDKGDISKMAVGFLKRAEFILKTEKVEFERATIAELTTKFFPDFRRVINELQRYSVSGKIDSGIFFSLTDETYANLVSTLKAKNFTAMRKWVAENSDTDTATMFRYLYDNAWDLMTPESVAQLGILLNDYQYKAAFVVDQEINTAACLTEIMASCHWK